MTPDEGIERLIFHTYPGPGSFLDMLRPYCGLRVEVLEDVRAALRASASKISAENLPRGLVDALWSISYCGRGWALGPEGMLRRNDLISDSDRSKLEAFLDRFDYAVYALLEGSSEDEAFNGLGGEWI